ncbi:MAG: hypothetical protein NUV57_00370 [archaeon]|nr:hypothetical protein [archaeon]
MNLFGWLKKIFKTEDKTEKSGLDSIYEKKEELFEEIHSIWDYIKLNDNSQAAHISAVLGFDEWISMDEILRRIRELFGMDYKNDRSLYPYIKTLVDIGLIETNNVGGKKKWRKRDVLIKLEGKKEKEEKEQIKETVKNR